MKSQIVRWMVGNTWNLIVMQFPNVFACLMPPAIETVVIADILGFQQHADVLVICLTLFCTALEAMLPQAYVHIFSTTTKHVNNQTTVAASQFDVFRREGFQVHLDGDHLFQHYFWLIYMAMPWIFNISHHKFKTHLILAVFLCMDHCNRFIFG